MQVIPPVGWVCGLPYDPATAATTAPLPKTTFPTVRVIKQAPCGKGGVFQLAITDRAKPMGAEEYRARAMARQGAYACYFKDPARTKLFESLYATLGCAQWT